MNVFIFNHLVSRRGLGIGAAICACFYTVSVIHPSHVIGSIAAGLAVISACVLGWVVSRWRLRRIQYRQPARVEYLEEPLDTGQLLYSADIADPLRDWERYGQYQQEKDITVNGNCIRFKTQDLSGDDWDYIFLDPATYSWKNISWELDFCRKSSFREYAFNFRYVDFDNRYRFRFEDDKLFFDKKVKGDWVNNISSVPFGLINDVWYKLRIDSYKSLFRCYVNGVLIMEASDTDISEGAICIILWEDDACTPIDAEIRDQRVLCIRDPSR